MKKTLISLVFLTGTLLITSILIATADSDAPVQAIIVKTQRRDLYQTIGLLGQISYADEQVVIAESTGTIADVYIQPGQRLAKGNIVISYDFPIYDEIAAFYSEYGAASLNGAMIAEQIAQTVQRADANCTVRDVYVEEGTKINIGVPIARITGTSQEIRCLAVPEDAALITPEMWAWIRRQGEELGQATIKSIEMNEELSNPINNYVVTFSPEQHIDLEEGEKVEVSIYVSGSSNVVSLPVEAITERNTVWWVNDEGRCTEIPAEFVMSDKTHAWVNLPEGIRVAVGEFVEGQKVMGTAE